MDSILGILELSVIPNLPIILKSHARVSLIQEN
jgi:hypothetical protein